MQYEYKIVRLIEGTGLDEDELNELGKEGWQLVAAMPKRFYFMRFVITIYSPAYETSVKCDHQEAYTDTGGWHCPKCNANKDTE